MEAVVEFLGIELLKEPVRLSGPQNREVYKRWNAWSRLIYHSSSSRPVTS